MSKDTTETYLNLNSEQFNSWIKEFDNKYSQVEKSNLKSNENNVKNLILSESEDSVEIQSDSDSESEPDNDSNIFIKNNKIQEYSNYESSVNINSSSHRKRLLFNRTKIITNSNENSDTTNTNNKIKEKTNNKISERSSEKPNNSRSEKVEDIIYKQNIVEENYTILSLSELNSILPDFNSQQKIIKKNVKEEIKNNDTHIEAIKLEDSKQTTRKLGETALYRFISNRRLR